MNTVDKRVRYESARVTPSTAVGTTTGCTRSLLYPGARVKSRPVIRNVVRVEETTKYLRRWCTAFQNENAMDNEDKM